MSDRAGDSECPVAVASATAPHDLLRVLWPFLGATLLCALAAVCVCLCWAFDVRARRSGYGYPVRPSPSLAAPMSTDRSDAARPPAHQRATSSGNKPSRSDCEIQQGRAKQRGPRRGGTEWVPVWRPDGTLDIVRRPWCLAERD